MKDSVLEDFSRTGAGHSPWACPLYQAVGLVSQRMKRSGAVVRWTWKLMLFLCSCVRVFANTTIPCLSWMILRHASDNISQISLWDETLVLTGFVLYSFPGCLLFPHYLGPLGGLLATPREINGIHSLPSMSGSGGAQTRTRGTRRGPRILKEYTLMIRFWNWPTRSQKGLYYWWW